MGILVEYRILEHGEDFNASGQGLLEAPLEDEPVHPVEVLIDLHMTFIPVMICRIESLDYLSSMRAKFLYGFY